MSPGEGRRLASAFASAMNQWRLTGSTAFLKKAHDHGDVRPSLNVHTDDGEYQIQSSELDQSSAALITFARQRTPDAPNCR
jgi:hypothetical protein